MSKWVYVGEKIVFLLIGLAAAIFILGSLKIWSIEKNRYFLFVGDYESMLVIIIVGFVIGLVIERLWKWEVRSLLKRKKGGR